MYCCRFGAAVRISSVPCAGKIFGRTPLIKLSPKKTVEGFVGGAIFTLFAAVALTNFLAQYEWMYCPRRQLEFSTLHCEKPTPFLPVQYQMTDLWEVSCLSFFPNRFSFIANFCICSFASPSCPIVRVRCHHLNSCMVTVLRILHRCAVQRCSRYCVPSIAVATHLIARV